MSDRIDLGPIGARITGAERRIAQLVAAASTARDIIAIDRACLHESHRDCHSGEVTDVLGLAALAEYDAALRQLDAAINNVLEGA